MAADDITQLLAEWRDGNQAARDRLIALVEDELRAIANRYLSSERSDHTLQATALINEAYIKLSEQQQTEWQNRAHFFGIAAQIMRRVLVDYARARNANKRDGKRFKITLEAVNDLYQQPHRDLVALDDALNSLAEIDQERSRIVELRFFGGLTIEETARYLDISNDAVKAQWKLAKAWLYREISRAEQKNCD